MYCPNHPKGQCPCEMGLKRRLAEQLILDHLGQAILSSPAWLIELEAAFEKAYTANHDRAPLEEANLRRQLADIELRRENLMRLAEKGDTDPDLMKRVAERRREAQDLRDRLHQIEASQTVTPSKLTRESLVDDLKNLSERLRGSETDAGEVLRRLLGGRIIVAEVKTEGSSLRFLRGSLQVRVYDVSQAIGRGDEIEDVDSPAVISRVIDFIDPECVSVENDLRDRAWAMYVKGTLAKEISSELGINRNRVAKLLEVAADIHGETLVDGRSRRSNLARKHLEPPLYQAIAPNVMEQFDRGELYATIAKTLNVDINTIRKSVNWWHHKQGIAAPDGRSRRITLELKCQKPL
jgi:hypothetical protein